MIKVNRINTEWYEGMSVTSLLEDRKFTYHRITVVVNGEVIQPDKYSTTFIADGDNVDVIHLMAGG